MAAIESNTTPSPAPAASLEPEQLYFSASTQSLYIVPGTAAYQPLQNVGQLAAPEQQPPANFSNVFSAITALLTKITEVISKLADALKTAQQPTKPAETPATSTTTPAAETDETETSAAKLPFAEKEKAVLKPDSNNKVSELELRRGVVVYQLYQKEAKLADEFQAANEKALAAGETPTSSVKKALQQIVDEKKLSKGDANWVYSLSARAAQFEGVDTALSTSTTGSHGLDVAAAIKLAEQTLAGIQSGAVKVKSLTI